MDKRPKHIEIRDWIIEKINSGELADGERIPSENMLSEKFHVSRQTVRQAIAGLEADKILVRVKGSGTFAQTAPMRFKAKTQNIGVIITYLDDYVFPSIVQGIESILTGNNYTMTFGITYNKIENEAKALNQMIRMGVDGIIAEGTKSAFPNPNGKIYENLKKENIPCIFINGYYEDIGNGYVIIDDNEAGAKVTDYLISKGHTNIAGLFKSDDMQGHQRYKGFAEAMYQNGKKVHDEAVIWYTTEDFEYLFSGNFDEVLLKRISSCTAIICYNDLVASKMINLFRRNHLSVPDDISVISFDNSSLAKSSLYDLTSIVYPSFEIGQKSAELILKLIAHPKEKTGYCFETTLFERNSVKDIKKD